VFFSSIGYNCVRKVDPTFLLHEVFGDCSVYDPYENGPFAYLRGIDLDDEGSLYVAQNYQIWRATPDGDLAVVAKSSYGVQRNDPSPALDARMTGRPRRLATGPNNEVFFADEYQVGKIYKDLPTFAPEIDVPDGDLVHVFASYGRHLRTRHGLTGATLREFVYDAGGLLREMRDPFGNTVQIERDPSTGDATAIVGPFGQRTTLSLDTAGKLAQISLPGGEVYSAQHDADGLLLGFTDPNGHTSSYTYDAKGRLTHASAADGYSTTLSRARTLTQSTVTSTSSLGRQTEYVSEFGANGSVHQANTFPDGTSASSDANPDLTKTVTMADGTVVRRTQAMDPRFLLRQPITSKLLRILPSGLTSTTTATRATALADPADLFTVTSDTRTVIQNGRTTRRVFTAPDRFVTTTPAGRKTTRFINSYGQTQTVLPLGELRVDFSYDALGRLTSVTQGARQSTTQYSADGFVESVTDSLGRTVSYLRDPSGRVTTQTLPDSRQVHFAYDDNGNVTSVTPPSRPAHDFSYTESDQLASYDAPPLSTPTTTTYAYTLDRELDAITRPDGQVIDYVYDAAGRLERITAPDGDTLYGYDPTTGQLITTLSPDGVTIDTTYDGPCSPRPRGAAPSPAC